MILKMVFAIIKSSINDVFWQAFKMMLIALSTVQSISTNQKAKHKHSFGNLAWGFPSKVDIWRRYFPNKLELFSSRLKFITSDSDVIDSDFDRNEAKAEADVAARLFDDDNFPNNEINSCRTRTFIEFKLKLM